MADTDRLIREWEASGNMAQMVAAGIARKIDAGSMHRFEDMPLNSALAAEWHVSHRTVSAAKKILGDHGILALEDRRYYIALPWKPSFRKTARGRKPEGERMTAH
jgi:DNA-binding transcriptional MocR family regulator